MDLFFRKPARSSSLAKPVFLVKRHASCPPGAKASRAWGGQYMGLPCLAGFFWPKRVWRGLAGGGPWERPKDKVEQRAPLLVETSEAQPLAGLAAPNSTSLEGPTAEASTTMETQLPSRPGAPDPAAEPLPSLVAPSKRVLCASPESLPKVGTTALLPRGPRIFHRTFGKGTKETEQGKREPKYVPTQPLYQDHWVKRFKVLQRKPRDRAFRVDASFSLAGLLSSTLLSAASHASQRDYSFSFWQELPEVKTRGLLEDIAPRQRHLQEALFEVITSEASYLRSLLVAVLHFQNSPALREALTRAQLHRLFSNLAQVKDVSERFLLELEEQLDQDVFLPGLGDIVLKHCPAFRRVYIPYVTNQMYQEQLLQQLMRESSHFLQVLGRLEEQPICQRQPLKSFLALPFQRITRLRILLENIQKLAPATSKLADSIGLAHKAVGEIVQDCNESIRLMEQTKQLVRLEPRLDCAQVKTLPLIWRGRWLVREGELAQVLLQEVGPSSKPRVTMKPIHLHLFSDLLLLSRRKEDGHFLVKGYAWTCHLKAELFKAKPLELPDWTFRLSITQNHTGGSAELVLKAASEGQRREWVSLLAGQLPSSQSS